MAVAAGTLALAQHQSWSRSASDQAGFATGADVQVDPPAPLSPGATGAVATRPGSPTRWRSRSTGPRLPASSSRSTSAQAAPVVRLRGDETPLPPARLFGAITPSGAQPGAALPAPSPVRTPAPSRSPSRSARPRAQLGRPAAQLAAALGPVAMTLTVLDRTGAAFQVEAGTLARGRAPARDRRAPRRRQGAVPDAGGLDHGLVRDAARQRPDPRPHPERPVAGRLDAAGELARPDQLPAQYSRRPPTGRRTSPDRRRRSSSARATRPRVSAGHRRADRRQHVAAQLTLLPRAARVPAIPAIATRAFMNANSQPIGSVVPAFDGRGDGPAADRGRGGLVPDRHRVGRRAHHRSRQPAGVPAPGSPFPRCRSPSGGWPRPAAASPRPWPPPFRPAPTSPARPG